MSIDILYPYRIIKGFFREFFLRKKRYINTADESFSFLDSVVFMVDGAQPHGGLVDRFKGIISAYALCKVTGKEFRINYCYPFRLEKYLLPNAFDWRLREGELTYSKDFACPKILMGDTYPWRLLFLSRRKRQIHMYYNRDVLAWINKYYKSEFTWKGLFNELFQMSPILEDLVASYRRELSQGFVAIHFRFQHLLGGDFKEVYARTLLEDEAVILRERCFDVIREIVKQNCGRKVLLAGDNAAFLSEAARIPGTFVLKGTIVHCDNVREKLEDDSTLKLLADFFLLSKAKVVYSVKSKDMYPSEFPMYAAMLGENSEFKRLYI